LPALPAAGYTLAGHNLQIFMLMPICSMAPGAGRRPHLDVRRSIKRLGEANQAGVTGVVAPASYGMMMGSPRIFGLPARVCATPDGPALGGPQASLIDWLTVLPRTACIEGRAARDLRLARLTCHPGPGVGPTMA